MSLHKENCLDLKEDSLKRVLVERCLQPADREQVRYKPFLKEVWEYLDRVYDRPKTFLHDLIRPVLSTMKAGNRDYQAMKEYLDLLIQMFDIAEDARYCHLSALEQPEAHVQGVASC
jgi:hypothetical protein